jgi:phage terminase large subunit-like protein
MPKRRPRTKDPVAAYARAVVGGRISAGKPVRLACARHLRDLKEGPGRGLEWRLDQALRAIEFFPAMLHLEDGRPFVLEAFQQFIVGSVFGWYQDGHRRFRTAYIESGKGSGKTPMAAGVGLLGLIADKEPAAEVYAAATTREQAAIAFKDAKRMVEAEPELAKLIDVQVASLFVPSTGSIFRPVSAEHRGLDGKRPHIGIVDELHEHPSALVVDKIRAGTKGRQNALIFEITNSGWDRHSVCWNHHEYSLKVLEGILENDSWFAYVCSLDEGDMWTDPKVWIKANPALGVTIQRKYVAEQVAEAVGMPSKENIVRRLNFCEWTEQSVRWLPMEQWDLGGAAIDATALRGRRCFGGLDLARVADLSALCLLFPPVDAEEPWKALMWYWLPEDDIQKRTEKDRVPYDVWTRDPRAEVGLDGEPWVLTTPGNTTDYGFIESKVLELAGLYQIVGCAFDRTFAGELVQALRTEGVDMIEFGQGFLSMAGPTAETERMVKGEILDHGGNPVLRWNAANTTVQIDAAGNIKPDKEHSTERIDGMVALIMARGLAMKTAPAAEEPNVYNDRSERGEEVLQWI